MSTVGRALQRSNCCVGLSPEVRGKSVLKVSAQALGQKVRSPVADDGLLRSLGVKPVWEGVWPHLDATDTVSVRTVSMEWNVPEKYGPHGVLFFFLIQKKPAIELNSEAFSSFIGDGFQVPELEGESESSGGLQAGNVNNEALHVIGLHGSGDKISLFLQDWELAKVALCCQMALDRLCQGSE